MDRGKTKREKDLRERLERFDRLLALVQRDFEGLSPGEKIDHLLELENFGLPEQKLWAGHLRIIANSGRAKKEDLLDATKQTQQIVSKNFKLLCEFLNWFHENREHRFILRFLVMREISWNDAGPFSYDVPADNQVTVVVLKPTKDGPLEPVKEVDCPPEFVPFIKAMEGIPLSRLKKCDNETCGKLFIQTGERERRFCCQRCQNTSFVRNKKKEREE